MATALHGVKVGLAVRAGFLVTVQLTDKLFRPWRLFPINRGYQLGRYLAMAAILGQWGGR